MDSHDNSKNEDPSAGTARNKDRDSLFMQARMAIVGYAEPVTVRVRNLSEGGMLVESSAGATQGTRVIAELPNVGKVCGRVVWAREGRLGVAFDQPVDPQAVRRQISKVMELPTAVSGLGLWRKPPTSVKR